MTNYNNWKNTSFNVIFVQKINIISRLFIKKMGIWTFVCLNWDPRHLLSFWNSDTPLSVCKSKEQSRGSPESKELLGIDIKDQGGGFTSHHLYIFSISVTMHIKMRIILIFFFYIDILFYRFCLTCFSWDSYVRRRKCS